MNRGSGGKLFSAGTNEHNGGPGQDASVSTGGRDGGRADDRKSHSPAMTSTQFFLHEQVQVHTLSAPRQLPNQTAKGRNTSPNEVTLTTGHSRA